MTLTRRLGFEPLESRRLLAADLELVSVTLTNAQGVVTGETPVAGEKIYAVAHYRITDLTAADVYDIHWKMDGVATGQYGFVGIPGTDVDLFWFHGGFIAQPGASHALTVTIDSGDAVAESDETNNAITLPSFTPLAPASLPQKFITPIAGTQNVDWVLGGYVDVNPRHFGDDPLNYFDDYQGNTPTTRDFHNGLDFGITNFAAQDAGVEVLAAADGTVVDVRDGFFDRETFLQFGDPGNFVFIDHGDGWVSSYFHFQRDSITVEVNDLVTAGQVLGMVGSSGNSAGPHLPFEIQHHDAPVDPFTAPSDYFVDPLPYVNDPALPNNLLSFGVTNDIYDGANSFGGPPFEHVLEEVSDIEAFPSDPQELYAWAIFTSVEAGDTWRAELYRPDGALANAFGNAIFLQPTDFQEDGDSDGFDYLEFQRGFGTTSGAVRSDGDANFDGAVDRVDQVLWGRQYGRTVINGWDWGWYRPGFTDNDPGTWRVDFFYNDVKVGEQPFEVGIDAPEIRLFQRDAENPSDAAYLIDGRTTPIDVGSVGVGEAAATRIFRVENHGYADLAVSGVQLPGGFSIVEPLSATIAAGASDTFTVQMETAQAGVKRGVIQIDSSDGDEANFMFAVEGEVTVPALASVATLSLENLEPTRTDEGAAASNESNDQAPARRGPSGGELLAAADEEAGPARVRHFRREDVMDSALEALVLENRWQRVGRLRG